MEGKGEPIEEGKHCSCGGIIDKLYLLRIALQGDQYKYDHQGRCFKCGRPYIVIER